MSKINRLDSYDADKDLHIVQKWYKMIVETPLDEASSLNRLEKEAKDMENKPGSRMEHYFRRAMRSKKSDSSLWKAENVAMLMYTDDDDQKAFFKEYNKAAIDKQWEPYQIYTALLLSALKKLAKMEPILEYLYLYRGFNCKLDPPNSKRIFWKTFTSTSLSLEVAQRFAGENGIVYEFQPPVPDQRASLCAAKIKEFSRHPEEDEVILLPFEAFDVVMTSDQEEPCYFKTSETQELLK